MFKKSLVALALITASTGAFAAADISTLTVEKVISIEGSASLTEVGANDVIVTLGAEYAVGDVVTFTFTGAELDDTTAPTTLVGLNPTNNLDVTLGLLSATPTLLTYRVTEVKANLNAGNVSTIGAVFTVEDLMFDRDTAVAGDTTVAYAAETSTGVAIDKGTKTTADLFSSMKQFALKRTAITGDTDFDAIIDVEAQRLTFKPVVITDVATFETVDNAAAVEYDATAATFDVVLNGSFDFLDEDDTTAGIQVTLGTVVPAGGVIKSDSITWTGRAAATETITIDVSNRPADVIIPEVTFSVSATVDFTDFGDDETGGGTTADDTAAVASNTSLGEWALNGSVVNVPYVPFGPATQPIIRHTNVGSQTGDISLRYMVEGVHTSFENVGIIVTAATPGVRNLLSLVTAALAADGYDASVSGFKVALEVTTNVPAADVTVYAAAKVTTSDSDRLTIGAFSN